MDAAVNHGLVKVREVAGVISLTLRQVHGGDAHAEAAMPALAPSQALKRWWDHEEWEKRPWTCPRFWITTPGTPAAGTPCGNCGYRDAAH